MWKQMLPMKAHCGKSCIDGTARSTGENRVGLGGGFSYLDVVGMCDLLGIFRLFAAEYSVGHATHTDWRTQTENRPRSGDGNGRTAVRRDRATENQSTDASRKNKVAALASTLHFVEAAGIEAHLRAEPQSLALTAIRHCRKCCSIAGRRFHVISQRRQVAREPHSQSAPEDAFKSPSVASQESRRGAGDRSSREKLISNLRRGIGGDRLFARRCLFLVVE